jgi:hypothetical protein
MNLKQLAGKKCPEPKPDGGISPRSVFNAGYNQAIADLAEIEVEWDVDKLGFEIFVAMDFKYITGREALLEIWTGKHYHNLHKEMASKIAAALLSRLGECVKEDK